MLCPLSWRFNKNPSIVLDSSSAVGTGSTTGVSVAGVVAASATSFKVILSPPYSETERKPGMNLDIPLTMVREAADAIAPATIPPENATQASGTSDFLTYF